MYFTKLRLNGLTSIDLPIVNALPSDMYILKGADGLGPPEVDVSIANTLNAGGFYQGRRPQSREVVIRIGLNPNYGVNQTVGDLRESLYGMLTPGLADKVKIEIMDGDISLVYTEGYVKKMEIAPFSDTPEVQLTIACLQQYLLTEDYLFVDPGSPATPVINNVGTAPAGFYMEVIFLTPLASWSIYDAAGTTMEIVYDFLADDTLIIDTRPGSRGIWVMRDLDMYNIIWALTADSTWYMLHGGENELITTTGASIWGNVAYLPQYWGI